MSPDSIATPAVSAARASSSGVTTRPGFRCWPPSHAGDVQQHAAGDHRRRVLDAETLQTPVGDGVGGGQTVVQPVALGEMPERVDVRADMRGHLDPLDIGAGVVGGAHRRGGA